MVVISLVLWRTSLSSYLTGSFPSKVANVRSHLQAGNEANGLRWGIDDDVVILEGQQLQRPLPLEYPNGAINKFQCDLPTLRYQCDMDGVEGCKGYPQLFPSAALFDNWKQESTARVPEVFYDSICHFNVSMPYELRLAQMFREMEVPFVAYGVPELTQAANKWTNEYLTEKLSPKELYKVHVANDRHFMYYSKSKQLVGEKETYESRWMTYPEFMKAVDGVTPLEMAGNPHKYFYFMLKATDFLEQAAFVYEELPFMNPLLSEHDPRYGDLFIRAPAVAKERGMRCRFGMQGIVTDGHIDGGFNHISMIRGTKRYVIAPPSACRCQGLLTTGQSERHTSYDWSNTSALPEDVRNCPGTEVALTAGEVLYLPSFWYHHIVSLDTSIQCNLRSGFIERDDTLQFLSECGLS
uniref:JmjC domain-containing protein n=1 Tax=Hyaloperonospora arabidopsidis (strain Emoy2) TaxID=559515 RepID=M4BX68_HYAAE